MATKPTRWLARLLGRRGTALLIFGIVFILTGVKTLLDPTDWDPDRLLLFTYLPAEVRAALWGSSGILAIIAACKRDPGHDSFGFVGLVVPSFMTFFSYVWSTVAFLLGEISWGLGWHSALVWLLILAFISMIAGWPEPVPLTKHPRRRPHKWNRS